MFINDVGQSAWEEINDGVAGANYGWPATEGPTSDTRFRGPVYAYGHGQGETTGCAITGGAFYNPPVTQFPGEYVGRYFFADICSGWIRVLDPSSNTAAGFATGAGGPVDLRVAADGSLYYLARNAGAVFKIEYPANRVAPSITAHPANQTVAEGQPAQFSVAASGPAPLAYQWQRNGADIPGANSQSYTTPPASPADDGARFRCVVSNAFGGVPSGEALLTVTASTATAPVLLAEEGTGRGAALNPVTMTRDPFPLLSDHNLSEDRQTRVTLFAVNVDPAAVGPGSPLTAQAEDTGQRVYPLAVEFVGRVQSFDWLTQVIVRLPAELPEEGDVQVSVSFRGLTSNKVAVGLKKPDGASP
jgi:hypothetical protein